MRAHYTDVAMSVPPAFCAENDIRHVGSPSCSGKLIYSPKEFFVTTYFSKNRTPLLGQALINWTGICFGGFIGTLAAAIPGLIDLLSLTDPAIRKTALIHMAINLVAVALYAINIWLRTHGSGSRTPLILSASVGATDETLLSEQALVDIGFSPTISMIA